MTPEEAILAVQQEVNEQVQGVRNGVNSRLHRAANELRNAELEVLSGPSPSSPGNPPGVVSGDLRRNWSPYVGSGFFGIRSGMDYAAYLENGTIKMEPRPFVEKIKEQAMPNIISIFQEIGG